MDPGRGTPHCSRPDRNAPLTPQSSPRRSSPFGAGWALALVALALTAPARGASYKTANFEVEAPTQALAEKVAQAAEKYRQEIAKRWLGRELPTWRQPCPVEVTVTIGTKGGASTFYFDHGRVVRQRLTIQGPVEELLPRVLPHEVTHAVLAHFFGCPVPRWADEGSAVLGEDQLVKDEHDRDMLRILETPALAFPLTRLLDMSDYPGDLKSFYTQSYSLTRFLVEQGGRKTFLGFVDHGLHYDWDSAVRLFYRYQDMDALERAWKADLRRTASLSYARQATLTKAARAPARGELLPLPRPTRPAQEPETME